MILPFNYFNVKKKKSLIVEIFSIKSTQHYNEYLK